MKMHELKRLATMTSTQYETENPDYQPLFPKGWDDASHWPDFSVNNYGTFRSTQIEIDYQLEKMAGCYE
jgi:hypothetical protein